MLRKDAVRRGCSLPATQYCITCLVMVSYRRVVGKQNLSNAFKNAILRCPKKRYAACLLFYIGRSDIDNVW